MSLNLYMEPVNPPNATNLGGVPLKSLLCRAFGQHDGSLREDFILTRTHLLALNVLKRIHNVSETQTEIRDGIDQVIAAIEQHGAVHLYTDE